MKNIVAYLILSVAVIAFSACTHVTETGNPCIGDNCPGTQAGDTGGDDGGDGASPPTAAYQGTIYTNAEFGVEIDYPSDWSSEVVTEGDVSIRRSEVVDFASGGTTPTIATVTLEKLGYQPQSLASYLSNYYPTRSFARYATDALSGYVYDDPIAGSEGGDLKEYFFLNTDVLVHVQVQEFPEGVEGFGELLNGITFIN